MKLRAYFLVAALYLLLPAPQAMAETISISGSTTVQKYIKLAAVAYQSTHPDIRFNINGGGSTAGFAQQADGRINIGMMSRELRASEQQELEAMKIKRVAIALDAVVPVVSPEIYASGIHTISPQQLADIYDGKINNWNQIGGLDSPIIAIDKNIYHGTRAVFANYILGSNRPPDASVSIVLDSDGDILRLLQSSDQAIAYVGIGFVSAAVRSLNLVIDQHLITPSYASIRNGNYPMSRKLYLLLQDDAPEYIQQFVRFVLSAKGQAMAEKAGYLALE